MLVMGDFNAHTAGLKFNEVKMGERNLAMSTYSAASMDHL